MFGPFEIIDELSLTPNGSVARARRLGEEAALYVVKRFNPPVEDPAEPHWESAVFIDRARAQQMLAASGAEHWAPIHQVGVSESGAWFATNYLPLSAQKLIDGRIDLKPHNLYAIISAIVRGLLELKESRNRPHGDLKASNVLIDGMDLNAAHVLLTDLGSTAQATKAGEPGDVLAIGQILYGLVMRQPFTEGDAWPLPEDPRWTKLGSAGAIWRQLCNDMLVPVASLRLPLASVVRRLDELAPPRRMKIRRRMIAAVIVPFALLIAGLVALSSAERSARRQFCQSRDAWFGAFASALSDPARRSAYSADPDLQQVIEQLDRDHLAALDCRQRSRLHASLQDWRRFKAANAAVAGVQQELSPRHWSKLMQAQALKEHLEDLSWPQPAEFVGKLIDGARIAPGNDTAAGIDRLLSIVPRIQEKLPAAEADWKRLIARTNEIRSKHDKLLDTMAAALRTSAAAAVQVSDAGFFRLDLVNQNADLAERLADAVRSAWPDDVDRARLRRDVASTLDTDHLRPHDIEQFLDLLALNTVRHDEASLAAATLRKRLEDTSTKVTHSRPDAQETVQFERERADVAAQILAFEQSPFTLRMISDGTLVARRKAVEARVDSLLKFYHPDGPEDWLKTLPPKVASSDAINARWDAWRKLLNDGDTIDEMSRDRRKFAAYQKLAHELSVLLNRIDRDFPQPPEGLSEPFTKAAAEHREADLSKLLPLIDYASAKLDPQKEADARQEYSTWTGDLTALAKDFPIRKPILTLDDRPDEQWKQKPAFWDDPLVQALVKPDVERIDRLQAVKKLGREDLLKTAGEAKQTEIALAAWKMLDDGVHPEWPTQAGELTAELHLRDRILAMILATAPPQAEALQKELGALEPPRWQRFVEHATSESMLDEAIKSKAATGVTADQIAALSPVARYNFWSYVLQQGVSRNSDPLVRQAVADLRMAADELKDRPQAAGLQARLAELDAKEPFADLNPGEVVRLPLPGLQPGMEFHRVEPADARPFYLAVTEVSFAQFRGVVQSSGVWAEVKKLPWGSVAGQGDPRHGPRVWEWTGQAALPMSSPQYWLAPDDANDFPIPFRAGRFNRMVLAENVGGPPEPDHPMQQISAQGALYFAALCGCRLPTPAEWQAAYYKYEKVGATERWNLRDQTWLTQQRHIAQLPAGRWPDDGIFHPPGDTSPVGRAATAGSQNDGTLYFRHVSSPGNATTFHHLVGNVGEFVCSASGRFEQYSDKKTAAGIGKFADENSSSLFVIGGSALSPPQLPVDKPLPIAKTSEGYADVGLRLAFTAPARSLAERVHWLVGNPQYLWPSPPTAPQANLK